MIRRLWLTAAVAVAFVACGGAKPPTYQLTQAKSAVRGAVEVGAKSAPDAALYLKMARDNVRAGEDLIVRQEYGAARHLLTRAEADANLAIALAKEAKAKAAAQEMKRKLLKLRAESEQGGAR